MDRIPVEIHDSYITLGQFLKLANIISSGGMAKPFLQQMEVFVNDESENRRGKNSMMEMSSSYQTSENSNTIIR